MDNLSLTKDTVKKGYEVIMARGQHGLELADAKLFNFLLTHGYSRLNDRTIHTVAVSEVLGFLKHTSVTRLEASLKALATITIEIDYTENGVEHSVSSHILSYDVSKTENGRLVYAFDPILLRFLWEPRIYGTINLSIMKNYKSSYAAKLYEIMSMYQHRFHRTWKVSLEELRAALGVPDGGLVRFDNFRRVFEKAVSEVNALATFGLKVDYIRGGRGGRVVEVHVCVVPRVDAAPVPADAIPAGRKKRDPHTVDLLDGRTDAERGTTLVVSTQALEEARSLVEQAGRDAAEVDDLLLQWREAVADVHVTDAGLNFLRWLSVHLSQANENETLDLEDDVFADLLREFE